MVLNFDGSYQDCHIEELVEHIQRCLGSVTASHKVAWSNCLHLRLKINQFNADENGIELKTYMWIKCKSGFMKCQF
jgi:hypothetical protein